jgi:uncharacterized protein YndB with AHSA1/START domain
MLKIVTGIVAAFAILCGGVVAVAATRPDTFRIERSAAIKAPPEKIYAIIHDLRHWPSWSPWQKLDPGMKVTNSGPVAGKGAVSEWSGNSKVGSGRTEITEAIPPSRIIMKLDMLSPLEAHNIVEYKLEPNGEVTTVTWAMHGTQPLLGKVVGLFIDCDKMVGQSFEEGLANLKALVER